MSHVTVHEIWNAGDSVPTTIVEPMPPGMIEALPLTSEVLAKAMTPKQAAIAEAVKAVVPAQPVYTIAPKILVYGDTGTGKSYGIMRLPGVKFIVDTEGGSLPYRQTFPFSGPDHVVDDFFAIRDQIDAIMANPGLTNVVCIDSITIAWESLVALADDDKRKRTSNRSFTPFEPTIDIGSWEPLKRIFRNQLIKKLRNTKLPVVVTAQHTTDESGVFKPLCEKTLRSHFDIVLHSELIRVAGGVKYQTYVERVRGTMIQSGKVHDKSWFEIVTECYGEWFSTTTDAEFPSQEMVEEWNVLTKPYNPVELLDKLHSLGVDRFEDMPKSRALTALQKLRERAKLIASQTTQRS